MNESTTDAMGEHGELSAPLREALALAGQALHLALVGRDLTRRNYSVLLGRLHQSRLAVEVLTTLAREMELLVELRYDRLELIPCPGSPYRWSAEDLDRAAGRDGREVFAACLLGTAAFFYPGGVDADSAVLARDEARLADIEGFISATCRQVMDAGDDDQDPAAVRFRPLAAAWLEREAQAEGKGQTKTRRAVLLRALRLLEAEKLVTIEASGGNPLIRPRERLLFMLRSLTRDERYQGLVALMTAPQSPD